MLCRSTSCGRRVDHGPRGRRAVGGDEVVGERRRDVARVMKGLLAKPLRTSFKMATEVWEIGATMTTARGASASGASKCRNAKVPNVSAARRPAPIEVSAKRVDSGPSVLSAVIPPRPHVKRRPQ